MGNVGSSNSTGRRRHRGGRRSNHHTHHPPPPPPPPPQPDIIFAAATPYPSQYPNPNPPPYFQYPTGAYYPPPPLPAVPLQAPHDTHHRVPMATATWVGGGRYPCVPVMHIPAPYVDHQKAVTIRNDVNIKKDTLKIEADEENPGKFIVSFTFDSTVACSITLYFFAKEGDNCNLTTVKENPIPPITLTFQQGLGQKFKQTPGTGIDLSAYDESELSKLDETSVYPLAVKAEAIQSSPENGKQYPSITNSQITDAVFEKVKGEFKVRVVKQILWVNGVRYELQEIFGIGNSVDGGKDFDGNDSSKECVICLSEPRDTTVLPCRHMCMCSGCANVMRFKTNRCPICRQAVERLLEIKVNNRAEE